jgi:MYXO-CTERM domain-containing protein
MNTQFPNFHPLALAVFLAMLPLSSALGVVFESEEFVQGQKDAATLVVIGGITAVDCLDMEETEQGTLYNYMATLWIKSILKGSEPLADNLQLPFTNLVWTGPVPSCTSSLLHPEGKSGTFYLGTGIAGEAFIEFYFEPGEVNAQKPLPMDCFGEEENDPKWLALCVETGGVYTDCGSACAPSCDNPEGSDNCIEICVETCMCDKETPIFDEKLGCISVEECSGEETAEEGGGDPEWLDLCIETGGAFTDCGSGCDPTCENPEGTDVCTKECLVTCDCKGDTPIFDLVLGCISADECGQGAEEGGEAAEEGGETAEEGGEAAEEGGETAEEGGETAEEGGETAEEGGEFPEDEGGEGGEDEDPEWLNLCVNTGGVYTECGSACSPTCPNPEINEICLPGCIEWCVCPDDKNIFDLVAGCIPQSDCPDLSEDSNDTLDEEDATDLEDYDEIQEEDQDADGAATGVEASGCRSASSPAPALPLLLGLMLASALLGLRFRRKEER